jgi:hypothetical protein
LLQDLRQNSLSIFDIINKIQAIHQRKKQTMNQAHWLTERLTEDKVTQLQKHAENERLVKQANEELPPRQPRHFLAKLRAELVDLSMKPQNDMPKAR